MRGIVDFHTHAFPDSVAPNVVAHLSRHYGAPISNQGTLSELSKQIRQARIHTCVVLTAATHPEQVIPANKWAVAIQTEGIYAFGTIHPDFPQIEQQLDYLAQGGIKGIKLHPELQDFSLDDPKLFPIFELIGDRFLLMIHLGEAVNSQKGYASPEKLSRIIKAFPHLKVIGAHLGGFGMWEMAQRELVGTNCYLDTSSVIGYYPQEEIVKIIRNHGAERILFGSDYPVRSPGQELGYFRQLPLESQEQELILTDNPHRLLDGMW